MNLDDMNDDVRAPDARYYDTLVSMPHNPQPRNTADELEQAIQKSREEYEAEQIAQIERECEAVKQNINVRTANVQKLARYWKYAAIDPDLAAEINAEIDAYMNMRTDKIWLCPTAHAEYVKFLESMKRRDAATANVLLDDVRQIVLDDVVSGA
jgi:hypothetical protein